MDCRTKTLFFYLVLAAAVLTASCGLSQQSRFQMAFLPSVPTPSGAELESAPSVAAQPNVYLKDIPPFLIAASTVPEHKTRFDANVQRAEQAFQQGKRLYQSQDFAGARREFDNAVDWMLEASSRTPADRDDLDRRLEQMVDDIHHLDLTGLGSSAAVEEGRFEKAPLEDILQMTFPVDPNLKDRVREEVKATVSKLPLSVNDTVLGYINYFANRGHGTLVAATERSGRYRAMILGILDEEGVPQELLHLAQAESGFIPRAVSSKAAGGMWQFLTERGNQYGLKQTSYTDERMDPEKATRAAARHLHDLYTEFGDWYLAIAAYNCGPGAVERAVERTGYADFWELRNRGVLPAETTNYVPIILAMTIMEKNAREYGLEGLPLDRAMEYDTIETFAPTSLALISDITGAPLTQLAELNPAVLKGIAPQHFAVHVPKGAGNQLVAALQTVPPDRCESWRMHTVEAGETLATIGKKYSVVPASIVSANNLKSAAAREGDRLLIPAAPVPPSQVHRTASAVRRPTPGTRARTTSPTTGTANRAAAPKTPAKKAAAPPAKPQGSSVLVARAGNK